MSTSESQVQVICRRWSPSAHRIKDFLARSGIPYRFIDIETEPDAHRFVEDADVENPDFPLVLFPDGSYLIQPSDEALAEQIGFQTEPDAPFYDLVIIGAGPAGLAAAVYGSSEGLRTIAVDKDSPGGQVAASPQIENYPGFPDGISGGELGRRMVAQVKRFGADILATEQAKAIRVEGPYRQVELEDDEKIRCHSIIIATGADYRTLDVPGAERLTGSGVYYGATSAEASSCRREHVHLLGGGNSAGQAALFLARFARRVTIITHDDALVESMSEYLAKRIEAADRIQVRPHSTVVAVQGDETLEAIRIQDLNTEAVETVPTTGLFVWIGATPHTAWLGDLLERDEEGYVVSGRNLMNGDALPSKWPVDRIPLRMETNVPGIFAAGDVRSGSVKRVTSAIGEGAMAIQSVHQYLHDL